MLREGMSSAVLIRARNRWRCSEPRFVRVVEREAAEQRRAEARIAEWLDLTGGPPSEVWAKAEVEAARHRDRLAATPRRRRCGNGS